MNDSNKSFSFMMELRFADTDQLLAFPPTVVVAMLDHVGRGRGVDTGGMGRLFPTDWRQTEVFAEMTAGDRAALEAGGAFVVTGKALAVWRAQRIRDGVNSALVAFHGQHGDRWFVDPTATAAGIAPVKLARETGAPTSPAEVPFHFVALVARAALGDFEPMKGKHGRKKRAKSLFVDEYFQMIQFGRVGLFPEVNTYREIMINVCPYKVVDSVTSPYRKMVKDMSRHSVTVRVGYCDEYQCPTFNQRVLVATLREEVLKLDKLLGGNAHWER